jgi:hypothetical protein
MCSDVILKATNKTFTKEVFGHVIRSEIQLLKICYIFFHCTRLFKLGQMTQIMCVDVKVFIKACNKLGPSNIPAM